jgi:hypothetical protein
MVCIFVAACRKQRREMQILAKVSALYYFNLKVIFRRESTRRA